MRFQIYCFWTGPNAMSDNRLRCLKQFKETCGFPVQLVTPRNLHKFIIPSAPLHAAYPYLSETHKAPEIEDGVAYEPVYNNWAGNCAYICKPLTPLTTE